MSHSCEFFVQTSDIELLVNRQYSDKNIWVNQYLISVCSTKQLKCFLIDHEYFNIEIWNYEIPFAALHLLRKRVFTIRFYLVAVTTKKNMPLLVEMNGFACAYNERIANVNDTENWLKKLIAWMQRNVQVCYKIYQTRTKTQRKKEQNKTLQNYYAVDFTHEWNLHVCDCYDSI